MAMSPTPYTSYDDYGREPARKYSQDVLFDPNASKDELRYALKEVIGYAREMESKCQWAKDRYFRERNESLKNEEIAKAAEMYVRLLILHGAGAPETLAAATVLKEVTQTNFIRALTE